MVKEMILQGLSNNILTAEAKYPMNFTQPRKRFALSLNSNGSNSFLFVNAAKIILKTVKIFPTDFITIDINDILDIHKYLMKEK